MAWHYAWEQKKRKEKSCEWVEAQRSARQRGNRIKPECERGLTQSETKKKCVGSKSSNTSINGDYLNMATAHHVLVSQINDIQHRYATTECFNGSFSVFPFFSLFSILLLLLLLALLMPFSFLSTDDFRFIYLSIASAHKYNTRHHCGFDVYWIDYVLVVCAMQMVKSPIEKKKGNAFIQIPFYFVWVCTKVFFYLFYAQQLRSMLCIEL